jgi:hypothetical protein
VPDAIAITLEGLGPALAKLQDLPRRLQGQIERKAFRQGGIVLREALRAAAPVDSGLTAKSIGYLVKIYRRSGSVVLVVGPQRGYLREVRRKDRRKPVKADPARTAHLTEGGTKARHHQDGHPTGHVSALHWAEKAGAAHKDEAAAAIVDSLNEAVAEL